MTTPALLVIDIGTTVLKTSLFDFRCRTLDRIECIHGTAGADLRSAAECWWRLVAESAAALASRNASCEIRAIGLTGFMHAAVGLDAAGHPLPFPSHPARARSCFDRMLSRFGARGIYDRTGSRLDVSSVPPHVAAWREEMPAEFARIKTVLPVKDFVRLRLTGELATDEVDAAGTMLYDLGRRQWDPDLAGFCDLDAATLPPVLACTDRAGSLTAAAAQTTGLPAGIPVSVGGGDDIEILGSGARGPGDICEHVGTTGSFLMPTAEPHRDPECRLELYPGVTAGDWVLGGSCSNVARALDWFLQSSGYAAGGGVEWERVQADLDRGLERLDGRRPVFLPYLVGERAPLWNPDLYASFSELRVEHDAADLLVAVVEGVCFSLRGIFDVYGELGLPVRTIFSSGGVNRLETTKLRASVYGRPVCRMRDADPTSYAAAAAALQMLGEVQSAWEAAEWLERDAPVDPDPAWSELLEQRYCRFLSHTRRMQDGLTAQRKRR